jgi:glycosyltransferase involved in cell wall biosynthesis
MTEDVDVLILGPLPPPYGGVSAHVDAVRRRLIETDVSFGVLNHFRSPVDARAVLGDLGRNPIRYWFGLRNHGSRLVHYHHSRMSTLLIVGAAARRDLNRRYVISVHGHGLRRWLDSRMWPMATLTRWALRSFDEVIAVSEEIAESLVGIDGISDVTVLPAFVEASQTTETIDPAIDRLLRSSCPSLVVAAYRVTPTSAGELYGIDLAIRALDRLAQHHPSVGLCVLVAIPPKGRARRYLKRLQSEAVERGHADRLLIRFETPLSPVFGRDVIFVRPSLSDGDAVSIREALAAGVPVVASDVVERPAGTAIFRTAHMEALCDAVEAVLADRSNGHEHARAPQTQDGGTFARLMSIYNRHRCPSSVSRHRGCEYAPPASVNRR